MLGLEIKNNLNFSEEKKKEKMNDGNSAVLYLTNRSNNDKNKQQAFFEKSSGKILINSIFHPLLSKKFRKIMKEFSHEISLGIGRARYALRHINLDEYIPLNIFILAISCGAMMIWLTSTGIISETFYGDGKEVGVYSAISEELESDIIVKTIGKNLEDRNLALISSNQCDRDFENSQSSEMCGANVKNEILEAEERRIAQKLLTAQRAAQEAKRRSMQGIARTSAPMPATFTVDAAGRRVCEKKNDKPRKSKENNKGKIHMDMECCLDPDEIPNPNCYYDPGKYRKYLK